MQNENYCKDCSHMVKASPLPRCGSSKFHDMVTGDDKRPCLIERLDGIGRCGTMGNNFTKKGPEPKKAVKK